MPNIAPNITVSESGYANITIPTNTEPSFHSFSERNGYTTSILTPLPTEYCFRQDINDINNAQIVSGDFFEIDHGDVFCLKELMNRIYKLEIEVYELKQQLEHDGGTIKL